MELEIWKHRKPLKNTIKALQEGCLTVGFIGGSITDERPGHNWPETVIRWISTHYPDVRLIIENAGIGATGSDFAVLRVERDLISRGCDLVFVEFAVNDNETPADQRERTREGLLRKLLKNGATDVVLTYTYSQPMYEAMVSDEVPASVQDFERLAAHYGLGSVWMGLYAFQEIQKGQMKWEEWLPDGLHPTFRGSYSYGESVGQFLEKELYNTVQNRDLVGETLFPSPLNPKHWGHVTLFPLSKVNLKGPWSLRRSVRLVWADQILETSAIKARLSFDFNGNGLVLVFDFGTHSSEFRYRLDKGEWKTVERDRPDWVGESGWLRSKILEDDLFYGNHTIEIEVVHGNTPESKGTNFRLTHIGIIRYEKDKNLEK